MRSEERGNSSRRTAALSFGIVSSEPSVRVDLEKLCASLSGRLDFILYPLVVRSYSALAAQISTGNLDVAWVPPLIAADLLATKTGEILACSKREAGSLYHSVVFAKKSSGITSLLSLRGRVMAWVDRTSSSGYAVPRQWMLSSGIEPEAFFSRETFAGTHTAAVETVMRGAADAGATYALLEPRSRKITNAGWSPIDGADDELVVVASTGAVPADVVAMSTRLRPESRAQMANVLVDLSAAERDIVKLVFHCDGFERCLPVHVKALERLRQNAEER